MLLVTNYNREHSKDTVQLMSRHWDIFDSLNENETVDGEGVIGKVLRPGRTPHLQFRLPTIFIYGSNEGHFNMINFTSTRNFKLQLPTLNSLPFFELIFCCSII
jgi:ApaG protein